jgi:hypothetical protein
MCSCVYVAGLDSSSYLDGRLQEMLSQVLVCQKG